MSTTKKKRVKRPIKNKIVIPPIEADTYKDVLSKADKMAIIRDFIKANPDCNRYGFNREIITFFQNTFNIVLNEGYVSQLIAEVKSEWEKTQSIYVTKGQIVEMYLKLYENTHDVNARIRILMNLAKIEGHAIDRVMNFEGVSSLSSEKVRELYDKMSAEKAE